MNSPPPTTRRRSRFYSNLFGWDAIRRMDMGAMGVYLVFGYDGEQKGGMYIKPPDVPAPARPGCRMRTCPTSMPCVANLESVGG